MIVARKLLISSKPSVIGRATYGASASSTSHTITYPGAGEQSGDLALIFFMTGLNGNSISASAADFTIFNTAYAGVTVALFAKRIVTETSFSATFGSSTGNTSAAMVIIRGGFYSTYSVAAPTQSSINPPAVNADVDNIVVTFGSAGLNVNTFSNLAESGYTVAGACSTTATAGKLSVVGTKVITASGSEDPAAYTFSGATIADTAETMAASVVII